MDKLFLGLVLVLLDLNISFGTVSLDLIPDFLGHFWVAQACIQLLSFDKLFHKVQLVEKLLTVYSGIVFLLHLFGADAQLGIWRLLLDGVQIIGCLIAVYWLICGLKQIEQTHSWDLSAASLQMMWPIIACLHSIALVLSWIPVISLLVSLAAIVASVCFLAILYKSRQQFTEHNKNNIIDAQ